MSYFFDSYAIIEAMKASKAYQRFEKEEVVTTAANLEEVFYYCLREGKFAEYKTALQRLKPTIISPVLDDWEDAALMKFSHKKKNLSLIDCLGYKMAIKNELKFLTGDRQFEGFHNVEFVK